MSPANGLPYDPESRVLSGPLKPVRLSHTDARLLAFLQVNRGRWMPRERIHRACFPAAHDPHIVHGYLLRLRRAFQGAGVPFALENRRDLGWRLPAEPSSHRNGGLHIGP